MIDSRTSPPAPWWSPAGESPAICIVGAGGGIGGACARILAAQGCRLVLMDLVSPSFEEICAELAAPAVALDLRDTHSIRAAVDEARSQIARLDGLVLASGVVDTGKLLSLSQARWDEVLHINLTGAFLVLQASLDWLADGSSVVTMSSLAARTGGVITGTAYAASKAGIEAMTKSAAQELSYRGIRVNCVSPGAIDTPMTRDHPPAQKRAYDAAVPLRRHGRAEEVAATVAFLLSQGAGYITGAVVPVNGGFRME